MPFSSQPDDVNNGYFKLGPIDLTDFRDFNIKVLRHRVAKIYGIENQSI